MSVGRGGILTMLYIHHAFFFSFFWPNHGLVVKSPSANVGDVSSIPE